MTLMSSHNSDGCIGRCDAKCYDATGSDCACICGGRNHGVGLKVATDNTREMADEMIEQYAKQKGIDPKDVKVSLHINQLSIFD